MGKVAVGFGELLNPIHALKKSTFVRLAASRQIYLDQIDKLFESELSAQADGSAGQSIVAPRRPPLTYLCNDDENVMTAWALGPDDKAKVILRALVEREVNRRELLAFAKEYKEQYALAGDLQQSYEYLVREAAGVSDLVIGGRGPIGDERIKQAYFQAALPEIKPPNELKNAELARVVSAMKQMRYQEQKEQTEVGRKARARIYKQRNR